MAEFCLECWNRFNHTKTTQRDWILSKGPDLCEGCGQWKPVIIKLRRVKLLYDLKHWRAE